MLRMIERIEREYARARKAGTLEAFDTMPIGEVEDLVLIPKSGLDTIVARLDMLEQELYERHLEESLADLGLETLAEDRLISGDASASNDRAAQDSRPSFFDHFFGYFARKPKQVA